MFPNSYYPRSYFPGAYFPGILTGGPPPAAAGGISRAQVANNSMETLKLATIRNLPILVVDSSDNGIAGRTLVVTISKDGGAFTAISPTVTDRGNGWYNLVLTALHTDTLGTLAFHITAAGAKTLDFKVRVEVDRTGASVQSVQDISSAAQAELGSVPPSNATPLQKIGWMFMVGKNKIKQSSTQQILRNDADTADVATAVVSDDGTLFTRNKFS